MLALLLLVYFLFLLPHLYSRFQSGGVLNLFVSPAATLTQPTTNFFSLSRLQQPDHVLEPRRPINIMASNSDGGPAEGTTPISTMPVELIIKVCWELADDVASLAQLGQACRALNNIVEPILYRGIEDLLPNHKRVVALLLSVNADPTRQNYIRSINLGY